MLWSIIIIFCENYQVILNQTLNNGKIEKSPRKNGKEELKTQETRGKRMKNVPKTPRSGRHLCFSDGGHSCSQILAESIFEVISHIFATLYQFTDSCRRESSILSHEGIF